MTSHLFSQPHKMGSVIPVSQMKTPRPREVAWLVELVSREPKVKIQVYWTPKALLGPEPPDDVLCHNAVKRSQEPPSRSDKVKGLMQSPALKFKKTAAQECNGVLVTRQQLIILLSPFTMRLLLPHISTALRV